jgi:hypothetical protein
LLVIAPAAQAGQSVVIDPAGTMLGRDSGCQLTLDSQGVSRRHAMVSVRDGIPVVEDLGSLNGTALKGSPVAGVARLSHGDRVRLADVEVEFRLTERHDRAAGRRLPAHRDQPAGRRHSLREELRAAPGFSSRGLLLAVAGSVVGTVLTGALGTNEWGSLAAAALTPVVAATFSTQRAGDTGRVRLAAIFVLGAAALAITWTGFEIVDEATGHSVVAGENQDSTLPGPAINGRDHEPTTEPEPTGSPKPSSVPTTPPTSSEAGVRATAELNCGTAAVASRLPCPTPVLIESIGAGPVQITGVQITGPDQVDFVAGEECVGRLLDTGESCEMTVQFAPSAGGQRVATLVIHQDIPPPDEGTAVALTGIGEEILRPEA